MFQPLQILGIVLVLLIRCEAQVESAGRFQPISRLTDLHSAGLIKLAALDNEALQAAADAEQAASEKINELPPKFAEGVPLNIDIRKDGVWTEQQDSRVWRIAVSSPGAYSLSLLFDQFYLPPGGELFLIGAERTAGAFVGTINNKASGKFASAPLVGDSIIVEYHEPLGMNGDDPVRLHIFELAHGFRDVFSGSLNKSYGASGPCHIDIACSEADKFAAQAKSVGLMITAEGKRYCSGAMINNVERDGRQLFLTAGHCLIGTVEYVIVAFNYESRDCLRSGETRRGREPLMQTVQGARVLSRWDQMDFGLLELTEEIPARYNVFLAGWDRTLRLPSNIACIHHPNGDVKKISFYYGRTRAAHWWEGPSVSYHYEVIQWDLGSTENGSSGSPMFNQEGLVVGELHGGQASCFYPEGWDMFGSFAYAWETGPDSSRRLREHLNPRDRNVIAMRGMYLSVAKDRGGFRQEEIRVEPTSKKRRID